MMKQQKTHIAAMLPMGVCQSCFLILLPFLFLCLSASAAPARRAWRMVTQSDGTLVEAMLVGDAHLHYYVSRSGDALLPDGKGRVVRALPLQIEQLEQRAQQRHATRRAITRSPRQAANTFTGNRRQLIILVDFTNRSFTADEPLTLWNAIFNQQNYTEGHFYGSVHDYFYDQSYGQFDLEFDLHLVHADNTYQYYGGKDSTGDDDLAGELVVETVKKVAEEVTDWSPYDWDGDGAIDQVFLLFAGRGQNDGGASNTIWPHQWTLSEQSLSLTVGEGKSYRVDNYGCFAELDGSDGYGTFGVLCHEYSHCLGLPDLYQTVSPWANVLGAWDVMDYGLYNANGYCPAGYSAYERMTLGWLSVTTLTAETHVTDMLPLSTTGATAYRIDNDAYSNEYFLIEHRQQTGWDHYLPSAGVLITHVDYDAGIWYDNAVNNTKSHRRLSLVPACGNDSLKYQTRWAFPNGEQNAFTNESKPSTSLFHANTDGTLLLSKPVTDIQVADGLASFAFMSSGTSVPVAPWQQPATEPTAVYTLSGRYIGTNTKVLPPGIYIVRYTDGSTRKVIL